MPLLFEGRDLICFLWMQISKRKPKQPLLSLEQEAGKRWVCNKPCAGLAHPTPLACGIYARRVAPELSQHCIIYQMVKYGPVKKLTQGNNRLKVRGSNGQWSKVYLFTKRSKRRKAISPDILIIIRSQSKIFQHAASKSLPITLCRYSIGQELI